MKPCFIKSFPRNCLGYSHNCLKALLLHVLLQENTIKYISHSPGSNLPRTWGKMVGKPLLAFPWWFWEGWVSQALLHPSKVDLSFAILNLILCKAQLLQDWLWIKKNYYYSDCHDIQAFIVKVSYLVSEKIFFYYSFFFFFTYT